MTVSAARRLPIGDDQDPVDVLQQPGDYCGPIVGYTGDTPAVFFLLPVADPAAPLWGDGDADGVHHVCAPPHSFRECPDGSLEIRESIGAWGRGQCSIGDGYVWHGYLDEGNQWRQV